MNPDPDELDDDDEDEDEDSETFELLVSFMVEQQEYGLYIPSTRFSSWHAWWMARRNWWRERISIGFSRAWKRNWKKGNGRSERSASIAAQLGSGLTIAHLSLPHLLSQGLAAAVIDVDRTLLPGRDVTLPEPVLAWLMDAKRRLSLHLFSNNPSRARIAAVADQLGVSFTCGARKPRRGACDVSS
ncbi:MAG: hypothetical protein CM15mP77_1810 [Synechococcus sp.]|nr:MAG: hypothetical protein CM15mP77_1810 [Synechococcus sp.]